MPALPLPMQINALNMAMASINKIYLINETTLSIGRGDTNVTDVL